MLHVLSTLAIVRYAWNLVGAVQIQCSVAVL